MTDRLSTLIDGIPTNELVSIIGVSAATVRRIRRGGTAIDDDRSPPRSNLQGVAFIPTVIFGNDLRPYLEGLWG